MTSKMSNRSVQLAAVAALALAGVAVAQNYDLSWHTIDSGGATFSTGGGFQLGGTIGQPDAGVPMTGGSFELTGGFWPATLDVCTLPGDMNLDGLRDGVDLQGFVNCLFAVNGSNCGCADLDGNGSVNGSDATALVDILLTP